jgi:hypothetical protein
MRSQSKPFPASDVFHYKFSGRTADLLHGSYASNVLNSAKETTLAVTETVQICKEL